MEVQELLRRNLDSNLLRLVTIGSVDDGKSTLIGRLLYDSKSIYEDQLQSVQVASTRLGRGLDLALLTDGLRAEREQGITIDVAYRYFSTPRRRFIIADCPGHEQYTRNMVTGASKADVAVLLIDASQGILVQSKRHAFIASLLGIPHIVVCVNKMDLVDWSQERYEEIRVEYENFAARLDIRDLSMIPVSAVTGDNVIHPSPRMPWYRGRPLLEHLESIFTGSDSNLVDLRFPVQYVLRPDSGFRGYSGRVLSGIIRTGEEITVLPSGKSSRVRSILGADGAQEYAFAGQSITVTLADELDISRGDLIAHPKNLPQVDRELEAMLVWMQDDPMRVGRPFLIRQGTRQARAHFTRLHYRVNPESLRREETDQLGLNEIGRVELELYQPIAFDEYARNRATGSFIVIDPMTNATVGAGMLISRLKGRGSAARARTFAKPASRNVTPHRGLVSEETRQEILRQRPATLWLTGLSSSGKSTIAQLVEKRLIDEGYLAYVLDGDNLRTGLNRDLGFSASERTENIRRISEVAALFNRAGVIVLTAFISPYREDRRNSREIVGPGYFVEVFVDAPLEVCEARDPKGLYQKARTGEIPEFTGVSAPYERPEFPEMHLRTDQSSAEECAEAVVRYLREKGYLLGRES